MTSFQLFILPILKQIFNFEYLQYEICVAVLSNQSKNAK